MKWTITKLLKTQMKEGEAKVLNYSNLIELNINI